MTGLRGRRTRCDSSTGMPRAGFSVGVHSKAVAAWRLDTSSNLPIKRYGREIVVDLDRLDGMAAIFLLDSKPVIAEDTNDD